MFVGIGLNLVRGGASSSPASLFANGEVGAWYDPSQINTLFQDSIGTTPVTAAGQPVGLMLDKSQGLVLGSELVVNGTFVTDSNWALNASPGGTYSISGGILTVTRTVGFTAVAQAINFVAGKTYKISAQARLVSGSGQAAFIIRTGNDTFSPTRASAFFSPPSGSFATYSWYYTSAITETAFLQIGVGTAVGVIDFDNVTLKSVAGNHATQSTSTQRPIYQVDSTSHPYLSFDGIDDGMVTGTITPGIDKVQVFSGVRKLSDAAQGIVVEMSATIASNNGAFALTAPNSAAANYNFSSKGTIQTDNVVTTYTSPITNVISGLGDIFGASNLIRVNGSQVGSVLTTQGTGNYLAYPLYIGRRGATTLPYNGRLYSLIMRFGANLTDGQITSTESWVNGKTGAY